MLSPDLASLSAVAVYAVVWGFVFVESGLLVGFLLPGDTILFGAGLLTAAQVSSQASGSATPFEPGPLGSGPLPPGPLVSLPLLAAGAFVAAVSGDLVGYATGRRLGRPWLERRTGSGRSRHFTPQRLAQAEAWTARWGPLMVIAARWIPWVRTLVPVIAGATRMRLAAFALADVVGALGWAVGLPVLGHLAGSRPWLRDVALAIAALSVLVTLVGPALAAVRTRRRRKGASQARPEGSIGEGSRTE
ncbi:MAG: DedA family protein [Actinomycetales bacterium]